MKLYTYQEELVNSKSDRIMINWCRGAGKDTGVIAYILKHKPSKVIMDRPTFWGILEYLEHTKLENAEVKTNDTCIIIDYIDTDSKTVIDKKSTASNEKDYDLLVFNSLYGFDRSINFKKAIIATTRNFHLLSSREIEMHNSYDVIEIDYKDAYKEDAISIDKAVEFAMEDSDSFYNQFAIKDKPKNPKVRFESFKEDALQRLQKQFMNTNDSKDTVLTRKNIIEMIKDLKTIN